MRKLYLIISICFLVSSCGLVSKASRTELHDDYYFQRIDGQRRQVYVNIEDQEVNIYQLETGKGKKAVDTTKVFRRFPEEIDGKVKDIPSLWEHSFDLDFLTIPLKFRPSQREVPAQLNSELNGAVFFGYRVDRYKLNYEVDPLGKSELESNRIGFSFGVFTGIGSTAMTPTTTNENIEQEYDGIVWQKGIAAIVGINNFTVGISLGFDRLLDENKEVWVYQEKHWLGLAVGLNLN